MKRSRSDGDVVGCMLASASLYEGRRSGDAGRRAAGASLAAAAVRDDASLAAAIVDFATAPGPCVKCDNRTVSPASSHAFPGLEAAMDEGCVKKAHLTKTPRSIHGGDAFGSQLDRGHHMGRLAGRLTLGGA